MYLTTESLLNFLFLQMKHRYFNLFIDELCKALFIQNSLISTWTIGYSLRIFLPYSMKVNLVMVIFRSTVTLLNGSAMLMILYYEGYFFLLSDLFFSFERKNYFHLDFALCLLIFLSIFLSKSIFLAGPTLAPKTCSLIEWLLVSMGCSSLFLSANLHWWSHFEVIIVEIQAES